MSGLGEGYFVFQNNHKFNVLSCLKVNSTGYSEFDELISARVGRYPLF